MYIFIEILETVNISNPHKLLQLVLFKNKDVLRHKCIIPKVLTICVHTKSLWSCPVVYDPMDCSLPGSSVHGTLQARILEGVAMSSSRGSSQPSQG